MKLNETFRFNSKKYREQISAPDYDYYQLARNIYTKRRAITYSQVSVASSAAASGVTGGASLIGAALSGRNISLEKQKLKLLEEEWMRCGQKRLPKRMFKDTVIPIVLATGLGTFAFSVDLAITNGMDASNFVPGYGAPMTSLEGHMVGAYYTGIEKGLGAASTKLMNKFNPGSKYKGKEMPYTEEAYLGGYDERDEDDDDDDDDDDDEDEYDIFTDSEFDSDEDGSDGSYDSSDNSDDSDDSDDSSNSGDSDYDSDY